jgi:hypothetical protein
MTIDLDDIESRISDGIWGDDRETDTQRDDAFSALATLVAEVERLRAIIGDQQILLADHQMDTRHAFDEGGHAERTAVVAWLRSLQPHNTEVVAVYLQMLADVIERGGHRREEGK